jgi:hypothetical protein
MSASQQRIRVGDNGIVESRPNAHPTASDVRLLGSQGDSMLPDINFVLNTDVFQRLCVTSGIW